MFGTILYDVFSQGDAEVVAVALEDICSPRDNYGWASVGVYAFFDPNGYQLRPPGTGIQYVGLASDLPYRFRQHTGHIGCPDRGCKKKQIGSWFQKHPELGFSCYVQSPLAQVETHRQRKELQRAVRESGYKPTLRGRLAEGLAAAKRLEGQLIESYRLLHSAYPPWNKKGGSSVGQVVAQGGGSGPRMLSIMAGGDTSLVKARRTIRQLSQDPKLLSYEAEYLHTARMNAIRNPAGASNEVIAAELRSMTEHPVYGSFVSAEVVDHLLTSGYLA